MNDLKEYFGSAETIFGGGCIGVGIALVLYRFRSNVVKYCILFSLITAGLLFTKIGWEQLLIISYSGKRSWVGLAGIYGWFLAVFVLSGALSLRARYLNDLRSRSGTNRAEQNRSNH